MADAPHVPDDNQPVIVADAEGENACHIERQLRRAGIKNPVVTFENGDDLHAYLVDPSYKDSPAPCVLFLDPKMPGANGYDPVRWIKRENGGNDVLVVIFSPTEKPEDEESASELGVHHFVKKHAGLTSLSPVVEHLGGTPLVDPNAESPAVPVK